MDLITIQILIAVFIATLIKSSFGFGEALVAVPLLSFLIPVEIVVPFATLLSITVAIIVVIQDRDKIHIRSAGFLAISSFFGIPLGLYFLLKIPSNTAKTVLGIVIIVFSVFCLFFNNKFKLETDRAAGFFGFFAGVLGGLFGMHGPALVMYGALRNWSPQHFRATLQGYFLLASTVGMCGYWMAGLWVSEVTHYYLLSLPACIAAVFLGRMVNQKLSGRTYIYYVHITLIFVASTLLFQSITIKQSQDTQITRQEKNGFALFFNSYFK